MTVSTDTNRVDYTGDGTLDTYPYTFRIFDNADLTVYVDGGLQVLDVNYSVTDAGEVTGGNVVFAAGSIPGLGIDIAIIRILDLTQETDYVELDKFPAETHEDALDKLTMIDQQLKEGLDRSLKFGQSSSFSGITVPELVASQFIQVNAAGTGLQLVSGTPVDSDSTFLDGTAFQAMWYDSSTYASINSAVTAIGGTEATLVVSSAETLTGSITFPATMHLKIVKGGSIVKASSYTVTINGTFEAGLYQVFSGFSSGNVTFAGGSVTEVYPEWWTNNTTPGTTDMGTAIQSAMNSLTSGGNVVFGFQIYLSSIALTIPEDYSVNLIGSGFDKERLSGTEIRSTLRDGVTPAITLGTHVDVEVFHAIRDLGITGGSTTEITAASHIGKGAALNNYCGLKIDNAHRGTIHNVSIVGFDTYGLLVNQAFYWEIFNMYNQYNGTGFKCVEANATSFYGCHAQYNIYGATDVQHWVGGSIQGQYKSGMTFTENGLDGVLQRVWFEGNNNEGTGTAGEADIYADNTNYQNVQMDSCRFSSNYDTQTVATHNFYVDNFNLTVSGSTRFYNGNPSKSFYFKNGSTIVDNNSPLDMRMGAIIDSTGAGAFYTFTDVSYISPGFNNLGTFTDGDATPDVGRYNTWKTANTAPTTITDFDGKGWSNGKTVIILIEDAFTTLDFTSSTLKGNAGVDWSPIAGDWLEAVWDGSNWRCSVHDCTA